MSSTSKTSSIMAPGGTQQQQANGGNDMHRLHTHDIELGASDALQQHISRHVIPPKPVSQRRLDFETRRPRM